MKNRERRADIGSTSGSLADHLKKDEYLLIIVKRPEDLWQRDFFQHPTLIAKALAEEKKKKSLLSNSGGETAAVRTAESIWSKCVETVQSIEAIDSIEYGDICWQNVTTAFEMERGHETVDGVFECLTINIPCKS